MLLERIVGVCPCQLFKPFESTDNAKTVSNHLIEQPVADLHQSNQ
jgi:hypothetical protein